MQTRVGRIVKKLFLARHDALGTQSQRRVCNLTSFFPAVVVSPLFDGVRFPAERNNQMYRQDRGHSALYTLLIFRGRDDVIVTKSGRR